ncbi:MAG: response regulator [Parvularcula sp.]|nr:response regulator [Parvularcula sp.]
MKILAVDDDPFILQLVRLTLAAAGYTDVALAESAAEAEAIISEADDDFDLFLLDVQMPGISGIELCRNIRADRRYRDTYIIILTAMTERSYIESAFAAGASDYLSKPFEVHELHDRLLMAEHRRKETVARVSPQRLSPSQMTPGQIEPAFALDDWIDIDDLSNFLTFDRFFNVLRQSLRAGVPPAAIYCCKIMDISNIYSTTSTRRFMEFLADTGDAISEAILPIGEHFTYAGSGYYLILLEPDARVVASDRILSAIEASIASLHVKRPDGGGTAPYFVVGDGIVPQAGAAVEATLSAAIKEAEATSVRNLSFNIFPSLVPNRRLALKVG